MKRYNFIYIVGFLMMLVLCYLALTFQAESAYFYGFAENKQTEISHDRNILISKIHVNNGQEIKEGDLLLEVIDEEVGLKLDELEVAKESINVSNQSKILEVNNKKNQIRSSRNSEIAEIKSDILELEKEIKINNSLYEGLKTIDKNTVKYKSPSQIKLDYLRENLQDVTNTLAREIEEQNKILNTIGLPGKLKSKSISSELDHYKMIERKLVIYAPFDGLVGTVSCKEGENISSFSSLLNLYKHNPTQVKGYVHESMILEVAVGDKLEVASTLHPKIKVTGQVIGLGSRIVEIPERLRKMADFKTYGREVIIEIPENNSFLQKEKVMLNISNGTSRSGSFGSIFSNKRTDTRAYAKPKAELD